jgi:hypothetical protein
MGLFRNLLGSAERATGRGRTGDPRKKGTGRMPRGKVAAGGRFGTNKRRMDTRRTKIGRGRTAQPAPSGLSRLFGSLTHRH